MLKCVLVVFLVICGINIPADAATRGTSTRTVSRTSTPATTTTTTQSVAARSATTPAATTKSPTVAARAATTQKVIGMGTKVVAANKPVVSNEECQQKYFGCMDSLCMLDAANGGRCVCSNKNATFDSILAEIEELDLKTYQMATAGVDSLEKGYDINAVFAKPESGVDLTAWDKNTTEEESPRATSALPLDDKTGDALFKSAHQICASAIPECSANMQFLQLLYSQQINNDCAAYENSLKQRRNESAQKLESARLGLLDASYTALNNANKWDLGQCAVEFKNCMISTGGCGADFSGCAPIAAFDATNARSSGAGRQYNIAGEQSTVTISASTYDTLLSKKPLCDNVTQNCQSVADQVWDTFLRANAPQIKYAELIAEDNARQDCIGNVSSCFQRACRDNIDPKDPSGSYDACLTRPGTMLSLCTVPLNACGISTESAEAAEKSDIWQFVLARLASMRVNSCTTEFKECLQSPDRCGPDYTQCVGLDTDTIMRICPYDTLVGCQQVYGARNIRGNAVYDELYNVAQGIFLNIDNEMLDYCNAALEEATIDACGDLDTCKTLVDDTLLGTRSLNYEVCEIVFLDNGMSIAYQNCVANAGLVPDEKLGRVVNAGGEGLGPVTPMGGVIDGNIYWDGVKIDDDGNISSVDEYFENIGIAEPDEGEYNAVYRELGQLQNNLQRIYDVIESDPTVQFCMTGREVDGIKPYSGTSVARFPELTKATRLKIANQGLRQAMDNYYKKWDKLQAQQAEDYATITERLAENRGENGKDARRDAARQSCVDLAKGAALPRAKTPTSLIGIITAIVVIVAVVVVVTVFTAGAGTIAVGAGVGAVQAATAGTTGVASTIATSAASAAAASVAAGGTIGAGTAAGVSAGVAAGVAAAGAGVGASSAAASLAAAASIMASTAAAASLATSATVATVVGVVGGAAIAAGGIAAATADYSAPQAVDASAELQGRYENDQWNYREVIETRFNMDTLVCEKCVTLQQCNQTKSPFFGNMYCNSWAEPTTECTDIQF